MSLLASQVPRQAWSPPFTPLSISGLEAWYAADQITGLADGDPVAQWDDLSGNARHAVQATAAKKPTFQTLEENGLPCVRCDGVDDNLLFVAGSNFVTGTTLTVALVHKLVVPAALDRHLALTAFNSTADHNSAASVICITGNPNDHEAAWRNNAEITKQGPPHPNTGKLALALHWFDATNANLRWNAWPATTTPVASTGSFAIGQIILGCGINGSLSNFSNVDLFEVLVYDGDVGATGRRQLEGYLKRKWAPVGSYYYEVMADNPALYWRLGEPSGTNANDETANNRDGTYGAGCTVGVTGAIADADTAVSLNGGTTGNILSTYNPFVNGGQITVEGWAYRDTSTTTDALFSGNVGAGPYLRMASGNQNVDFDSESGAGAAQVTWTAGWPGNAQWVHWVLTFDESTDTAELFINGVSKGTKSVTGAYNATPGDIIFGRRGTGSDSFAGDMDEIAVYTTILSPTRIKAHYDAGRWGVL